MDEQTERAKLELLDLTEDVIELILDKKRKAFARIQKEVKQEVTCDVIPEPEPVKEIPDEPTFYPTLTSYPSLVPDAITHLLMNEPTLPVPPMDRNSDTLYRWSALRRRMVPIN